ncbi:MAG: (2Fe-2S)-binding protein [Polyangiaceae bacterium]|nr:(2Fe-2S)-binding protein [Polyangiaceae bacterium]
MPRRLHPLRDPVELRHDGVRVLAERGEPIAAALVAADRVGIARSAKLHRPRGPCCLRGGCDGCLARVDGVPNVMTCRTPARGGEVVETQHKAGPGGLDLLRATDFVFPRGIDHHRLFAGTRGVGKLVQQVARHIAGLGRLPERAVPARAVGRRDVDVLVVGAGAAGLAAASALRGREVVVADDALVAGGSLALLDPAAAERAVLAAGELSLATTVVGLFRDGRGGHAPVALLASAAGATEIVPRAVVLAPGGHDGVVPFGNDDLPGVLSARAALALLRGGVLVGERLVLVGDGRFARALAAALGGLARVTRLAPEELVTARGLSRVTGVVVRAPGGATRRLDADAVVVEAPLAPGFELAAQAGAVVRFAPERGYAPEADAHGRVAPWVWIAGAVAGATDSAADGARVGRAVAAALGG